MSTARMDQCDGEASADLLRRARDGSSNALGALFDGHARRLLSLIRLRLGPSLRSEVESRDVLQAAFVKALLHFDDFVGGDRAALMAWLVRISENEIRDLADYHGRQRRDAARRVALEGNPEAERLAERVRSQTSRIALDEHLLRLEAAIETLAAEQREALILRRLEERSYAEIGERLGRSPDACRMLVARAMTALTLAMESAP